MGSHPIATYPTLLPNGHTNSQWVPSKDARIALSYLIGKGKSLQRFFRKSGLKTSNLHCVILYLRLQIWCLQNAVFRSFLVFLGQNDRLLAFFLEQKLLLHKHCACLLLHGIRFAPFLVLLYHGTNYALRRMPFHVFFVY